MLEIRDQDAISLEAVKTIGAQARETVGEELNVAIETPTLIVDDARDRRLWMLGVVSMHVRDSGGEDRILRAVIEARLDRCRRHDEARLTEPLAVARGETRVRAVGVGAECARRHGRFDRVLAAEVEVFVADVFVDEVELEEIVFGVLVADEEITVVPLARKKIVARREIRERIVNGAESGGDAMGDSIIRIECDAVARVDQSMALSELRDLETVGVELVVLMESDERHVGGPRRRKRIKRTSNLKSLIVAVRVRAVRDVRVPVLRVECGILIVDAEARAVDGLVVLQRDRKS